MKLLYAHWMQELDTETIDGLGIPSIVLMENASRGAADFFSEIFPLPLYQNVVVVAGKGNNGGDGLAIGRILFQKGYHVEFMLLATPEKLNPDPKINHDILTRLHLPITIIADNTDFPRMAGILEKYQPADTFIVDALFGTGLNAPVKSGLYAETIHLISQSPFKVAAVDLPSGLSESFLPEEGPHVSAHATATFQCLKLAHLYPDGNMYCGTIRVIDIGIPHHFIARDKYYIHLSQPDTFTALFGKRQLDAHKGSYGHCLTLCGSIEKPGAGILSSYAVLKSGAGLCTVAVCPENRTIATTVHPELMTLIFQENSDWLARLKEFDVVLAGPGLGDNDKTATMVTQMLQQVESPLVLDADALNVLQRQPLKELLKLRLSQHPVIITPHLREFSRLTGVDVPEIRRNRIPIGRTFAREFNVYLVLKGHHTMIITPAGQVFVNPTGNAGMATAGSGDVLSGVIAGMVAQFARTQPLAVILQAAVFIHGYAGDLAVGETGEMSLTATDIIRYIPEAIQSLDEYRSPFQFTR